MLISLFRFNFAAPARPRTGRISRQWLPHPSLLPLAAALLLGSGAMGQTTTTTSLTVTSGGQAASTVATGTKITLTASVKAGATTITRGLVNFCDASVTYCTDIHVLGSAQITSAGTATLNLRPAPGSYSYKAEFVGTPHTTIPYGPSSSSTATLTVTGAFSTATTIAQSGSPGDYTLTATVYGFAPWTDPSPAGTVSFVDSTADNTVLSAASLSATPGGGGGDAWINVTNPAVGTNLGGIVSGDFNGDGNLDLAVAATSGSGTVAILLGDGKGNFSPVTSSTITAVGSPVAVADFNGDGIPDLLLQDPSSTLVAVLLGKGDGTFSVASGGPFTLGSGTSPVFVADFNGDGIPDLASSNGTNLMMALGNGDGTFTASTGPAVSPVAVADFNGDGIPDLAWFGSTTGTESSVVTLLGNGDGTFGEESGASFSNGGESNVALAATMVVADFNEDGKLDLAIPYSNGLIFFLHGNGDGSFGSNVLQTQSYGSSVVGGAVGDFDGSVNPGLLLTSGSSPNDVNAFWVLYGSGAGDFMPGLDTGNPSLRGQTYYALGDFNGDGVTDIAESDSSNGTVDIFLTSVMNTTASVSGIAVTGASPQQVMASYAANGNFAASTSASTSLEVQPPSPVPAISSLSPAIASAGGAAFTLTITGSNFVSSSTVYWGTTALTTQYVSATELAAQVTAAQIATAGTGAITVQSPAPGGGTSNTFEFEIDPAGSATPPSFTVSTGSVAPGSTATYSVTLPSGATGVSVTCLNLPSGASCSYSAGTLTITTSASTPAGTYQITAVFTETLPGAASGLLFIPFLLLPLAGVRKRIRKESLWLMAFVALAISVTVVGCGGGSSGSSGGGGGTPAQTHQVTSSATVTLTVQ